MRAREAVVYVDDMRASFGRMKMCHMIADTQAELLTMAARIGVARQWLQSPGNHGEHFDICLSKRALAIRNGAAEVSTRALAQMCADRRGAVGKRRYFGATPIGP